jgi:hypothetical protein
MTKKNSKSKGPGRMYISVKDCSWGLIDFSDKDYIRQCFISMKPFPKKYVNRIIKRYKNGRNDVS